MRWEDIQTQARGTVSIIPTSFCAFAACRCAGVVGVPTRDKGGVGYQCTASISFSLCPPAPPAFLGRVTRTMPLPIMHPPYHRPVCLETAAPHRRTKKPSHSLCAQGNRHRPDLPRRALQSTIRQRTGGTATTWQSHPPKSKRPTRNARTAPLMSGPNPLATVADDNENAHGYSL